MLQKLLRFLVRLLRLDCSPQSRTASKAQSQTAQTTSVDSETTSVSGWSTKRRLLPPLVLPPRQLVDDQASPPAVRSADIVMVTRDSPVAGLSVDVRKLTVADSFAGGDGKRCTCTCVKRKTCLTLVNGQASSSHNPSSPSSHNPPQARSLSQ